MSPALCHIRLIPNHFIPEVTNMISDQFLAEIIEPLIRGQSVFTGPGFALKYFIGRFFAPYADRLHISSDGAGPSPYFLSVNPLDITGLESDLNKMFD